MTRLVITVIANSIALAVAGKFIDGFSVTTNLLDLLILGAILTGLNVVIRPFVKLLAGPLIVLTLGLFTIVVNALMLFILDTLSGTLTIQGYLALLWGTILVGVVNVVVHLGGRLFGIEKKT